MSDELVELEGSHRHPVAGAKRVADVALGEQVAVTVYVRRDPDAHPITDPVAEAHKHPRDRRYLSPAEVEASFGAASADLQAVVDYAESSGLRTSAWSTATRSVRVTGPAGALSSAFGVVLSYVRHGDITYRGRVGPVKIPASLMGVVEAVLGFDNRPVGRSYLRMSPPRTARLGPGATGLLPNTYLPPQVAQLYDFPASCDGTGETVAVFVFNGDIGSGVSAPGGYDLATVNGYFTQVLAMKPPAFTDVVVQGPGNRPGDGTNPYDVSGEVYLDLCIAGSLAPGANIVLYFSQFSEQGWVEAITRAATDAVNDPSVISISYGGPEDDPSGGWTPMAVKQVNDAFEAAAAAGRTICCAAGDSGAVDEPDTTTVHADFPASSPWVLACGGTHLESAAGAISAEVVWNHLADGNGATGGGVSAVFPRPSWQSGTRAVPLAGVTPPPDGRGIPDVASLADPETPFVVAAPGGTLQAAGGTSAAAPLWAALIGRLNQALGARVGYLNPLLYSNYSGALRDITNGDNGGYQATIGWDACTGWGSPAGLSLLQAMQGQAEYRIVKEHGPYPMGGQEGVHQMCGQDMDGQQSMINQLLTFVFLEKLLDDRGTSRSEDRDFLDILPLLLLANMSSATQAPATGASAPSMMTAGSGWDINDPTVLLLLASLAGRRTSESGRPPSRKVRTTKARNALPAAAANPRRRRTPRRIDQDQSPSIEV
jgi:kumamolisin